MPGLLLLLTRTQPGLAPVPGTSPRGELAVGPVFPTLEELPVSLLMILFPSKPSAGGC